MKLEGELAFLHSKMGVELDSQSFELNDSDQNSAGFKSRNLKVKEYENKDSKNVKKNERGFDSSPNNIKSANCMPEPKLGFYNSTIDLNNNYEAHVIGSLELRSHSPKDKRGLDPSPKLEFYDSAMVDLKSDYQASPEPVSRSSNDIGSFMMFANDKHSVKKSVTSQKSNPLQVNKFHDSVDVFVDQTVTECKPELEVFYKENSCHAVKDICVDKGVFTKHKFVFEESVDGKAYNFFPLESFDVMQEDHTSIQLSSNHDQHNDVMHKDDDEIEDLADNVKEEMNLHEVAQNSIPSGEKNEQLFGEPEMQDSNDMVVEEVLFTPPLGLAIDEANSDGSRSLTYNFGSPPPENCVRKEFHQLGGCNCRETELPFTTVKGSVGDFPEINHAEASQIHRGFGESSFSTVGAVSGRISYSGSVPYSGSISIRSDSSTTSTRSFAFPILQNEYNSSPVRMEKADRSQYRKHRKWKNGLFCCRF